MRRKEREALYERLDKIEARMISLALTVARSQMKKDTLSEPPIGSVVIDRRGIAWQRGPLYWSGNAFSAFTWSELNNQCGPLEIIYSKGNDDR